MADFKCAIDASALGMRRLEETLGALAAAGIGEIYCGVRDGVFEGPHSGGVDLLRAVRDCCALPIHVHLMVDRPERWLDDYVAAGAACVTVHAEACIHAHRTLSRIREAGASTGIALGPGTSLTALDYLLPLAGRVLLRTGYPASADPSLAGKTAERVRILKENIAYHEYRCDIEVEGGIDAAAAGRYIHFGARRVVLGASALPSDGTVDWSKTLADFKESAAAARQVV